jgi:hypothetical protein
MYDKGDHIEQTCTAKCVIDAVFPEIAATHSEVCISTVESGETCDVHVVCVTPKVVGILLKGWKEGSRSTLRTEKVRVSGQLLKDQRTGASVDVEGLAVGKSLFGAFVVLVVIDECLECTLIDTQGNLLVN